MTSEHFRLFMDDVLEVSIHNLVDHNGARVNQSWFSSSRKKATPKECRRGQVLQVQ